MSNIKYLSLIFLLCITGFDNTENSEIYKTYMHFGQISDNGKQSAIGTSSHFGLIFEHITTYPEPWLSPCIAGANTIGMPLESQYKAFEIPIS